MSRTHIKTRDYLHCRPGRTRSTKKRFMKYLTLIRNIMTIMYSVFFLRRDLLYNKLKKTVITPITKHLLFICVHGNGTDSNLILI